MTNANSILGVYLSDSLDLEAIYGDALRDGVNDVVLRHPHEIDNPEDVRFAICWLPSNQAFEAYPNLELAMSIGAGVDALLAHPGLDESVQIARVRDPHQADLMAGFAAHEVLHHERAFATLERNATKAHWEPLPMRAPLSAQVAVLGHGTMGRAVAQAIAALGFSVRVACRRPPEAPVKGVTYLSGESAVMDAADGADYLINVLPLTSSTENVLNKALFAKLAPGAWLVQIGRGEHLVEDDLVEALKCGYLAGASLDVFRQEPLPEDHPFWRDARLRITPHIASDSLPEVVAGQVVDTARALRDGEPLAMGVDRARGY
ncbi:hydroxyacid dehydrogenase [Halomonas sp. ISL-60]|uniref:NAD(P)-dependent oxidoreductase n=1 Tax=Halomonas sp. ISL-56 TaxID=2819149 RepID=UPI001BE6E545|nr:NAD(P)-dependent oxidoreductase [Halomonas sp. ISL-56]MBT2771075.1 hydroxyacid dehydrogenase [Halomonas sp. ISL-60]MBT2799849.1 hydroxyacid dehydrogenase [Halomonas sp. ISL-56]